MKRYSIKKLRFLLLILAGLGIASYASNTESPQERVPPCLDSVAFVFDLNGVFYDTNKKAVFRQIGIRDTLWYLIRYRSPKKLKYTFYETVHRIHGSNTNVGNVKDPDGDIMPQLMVDWLNGTQTNADLLTHILSSITANPQWFSSTREQRMIAAMANAIFDPQQFTASRTFIADLVPLVRYLKKRGASLYILSNWDKESFTLLKEKHKDFFELFDKCLISGDLGSSKPEQAIFKYAAQKIPHKHVCFFDDQKENIVASKCFGWHPILVQKKATFFGESIDITSIKQQLFIFLKSYRKSTELKEQVNAA
jgi:HAD superfamily hydrolase (TIGR01549 family)